MSIHSRCPVATKQCSVAKRLPVLSAEGTCVVNAVVPGWLCRLALKKVRDVDAKAFCQALKHQDRRIPAAGLDPGEVGVVDCRPVRELFLREALCMPQALYVPGQNLARIHARIGRDGGGLQP